MWGGDPLLDSQGGQGGIGLQCRERIVDTELGGHVAEALRRGEVIERRGGLLASAAVEDSVVLGAVLAMRVRSDAMGGSLVAIVDGGVDLDLAVGSELPAGLVLHLWS